MELNNANISEIKSQIKDTEKQINTLSESLKGMYDEKVRVTEEYEAKKADYEEYKSKYAEQSTYGLYFLIVTAVVFVVILIRYCQNSIDDFFMWPATALLIAGIVGKVIGGKKFAAMKSTMHEKEVAYTNAKFKYEAFMKEYNGTEQQLEQQQLKWELVENDMIEARKDAWIKEQRKLQANV